MLQRPWWRDMQLFPEREAQKSWSTPSTGTHDLCRSERGVCEPGVFILQTAVGATQSDMC